MMLASGSTFRGCFSAGLVHFEQGQVRAAGDVDQHALGAVQADFVQQRVGDGLFGGLHGAVLAGGFAGAHHRLAHLVHHRAHVGEVEVDQARAHHQVGHALDALIEHVIGHGEGFGEGGRLSLARRNRFWFGDDDQRVDDLLQGLDALFGLTHALVALELEGLGHHADGQMPISRAACAMIGAAPVPVPPPMPAVMKHMRAHQVVDDVLDGFFGGLGADRGARPAPRPSVTFRADLMRLSALDGCSACASVFATTNFDTLKLLVDHVVDRVACPHPRRKR